MGTKLYVGNLTDAVTSFRFARVVHTIRDRADAQVIHDREMGYSKGFGFVEMGTDDQAEAAIQGLNDHEHDGRRLVVSEAKPRIVPITRLRRWQRVIEPPTLTCKPYYRLGYFREAPISVLTHQVPMIFP